MVVVFFYFFENYAHTTRSAKTELDLDFAPGQRRDKRIIINHSNVAVSKKKKIQLKWMKEIYLLT